MTDGGFRERMAALVGSLPQRRVTISAPIQHVAVLAVDRMSMERAAHLVSAVEHKLGSPGARFAYVEAGRELHSNAFIATFGPSLQSAEIDLVIFEQGVLLTHEIDAAARWLIELPTRPAVICCFSGVNEVAIVEAYQEVERRRSRGAVPVIMRLLKAN